MIDSEIFKDFAVAVAKHLKFEFHDNDVDLEHLNHAIIRKRVPLQYVHYIRAMFLSETQFKQSASNESLQSFDELREVIDSSVSFSLAVKNQLSNRNSRFDHTEVVSEILDQSLTQLDGDTSLGILDLIIDGLSAGDGGEGSTGFGGDIGV